MAIASATDDRITVVTKDKGQKGDTGTAGLDGQGFNGVRQSLLDAPLCRLFMPNKLVDTLAGSLTATRATTATYVDRYGVVKTAAIDEMREESEGWLIEGASTNLLTYSEQLDNAAWVKSNTTITANAETSPDGTATADELNTTVASIFNIRQTVTAQNAQAYTASFYAKAGNKEGCIVRFSSTAAPTGPSAAINITNAEVTLNSGLADVKVKPLANGWVRVEASIVTDAAGDLNLTISVADGVTNATTGVIFLWGAQLEALPFASSYIPTTTAAATRAADEVSFSYENNYNFSSFTIASNINMELSGYVLDMNSPTNRVGILVNSASGFNTFIATPVGVSANLVAGTITGANQNNFVSMVYDGATLQNYINGSSGGSASGDPNTLGYEIVIGKRYTGTQRMFGHLRDFRIYDFAINADEAAYLAGVK
jgi:hypothetical protein